MTEPRTIYGTANPVDVLNALSDNCASSSCNNGPFTYTSTYVINLGEISTENGDTTGEMTLQLDPVGTWDGSDPNARGYYIDALKQIMGSKVDSKQQDWINGGSDGKSLRIPSMRLPGLALLMKRRHHLRGYRNDLHRGPIREHEQIHQWRLEWTAERQDYHHRERLGSLR